MTDNSSDDDVPDLVPEGRDDLGDDSSDDEDDICEEGEEDLVDSLNPAVDLFSKKTFKTAELCIQYCRDVHGLDLVVLKKRHSMDTFSFIRFINYLRTESPSPGFVMSLSSATKWEDDRFMKPVIPDDPILMYSLEDEEEEEENGCEIDISRDINDEIENVSGERRKADGDSAVVQVNSELETQIRSLERELEEKRMELVHCQEDMLKMRAAAQDLFSGVEETTRKSLGTLSVSEQITVEEDHSYFQSYAHYSIHYEMLSDRVRTESYRNALVKNPDTLKDAKVLDIGCGTGILSMFAAQAGASKVVGVDCSDIIYQAMDILRENKLTDKVELIKGRLEETKLPVEKFDFIISEWMGYFLLFEGMLDSVIAARERYLTDGGMVLPNRCTISLAAISDNHRYSSLVGFWDDVYGYKMTCMRSPILEEASVEVVPGDSLVSNSAEVLHLDINTCTVQDTEFVTDFKLSISKECNVTAIVGYFDTYFDLPNPVMFSTGPAVTPTHWKQTIFYMPQPIPVKVDQILNCKIVCKRMKTDARALKVALHVDDLVLKYTVD